MNKIPAKQSYNPGTVMKSFQVDLSMLTLRKGEFISVHTTTGECVEIRMDDEGNVGVCVSSGVAVNSFSEIYGN